MKYYGYIIEVDRSVWNNDGESGYIAVDDNRKRGDRAIFNVLMEKQIVDITAKLSDVTVWETTFKDFEAEHGDCVFVCPCGDKYIMEMEPMNGYTCEACGVEHCQKCIYKHEVKKYGQVCKTCAKSMTKI